MSTRRVELVRELIAKAEVVAAYDRARKARRFDTTASRRRRALLRVEAQANRGLDVLGVTRSSLEARPPTAVRQAALNRLAASLMRRGGATDAAVDSLIAATDALELERSPALEHALDGGIPITRTGATRARRPPA